MQGCIRWVRDQNALVDLLIAGKQRRHYRDADAAAGISHQVVYTARVADLLDCGSVAIEMVVSGTNTNPIAKPLIIIG